MAQGVFTPYSTVAPFFTALPTWVPEEDRERIASYQVYEEIYWNTPETFKLVVRGSENQPIYVPSGRTIVDTTHRYVGTGLDFSFAPRALNGSATDAEALRQAITALIRRERVVSKYNANRRYGLIRGDWLWHIVADDTKPAGSRISIHPVDPATYFPVPDPNNIDRILKVHLATQYVDPKDNKTKVSRLTYEKTDNGQIQVSHGIWTVDKWLSDSRPDSWIIQPKMLPPAITAFPVYHIPNFEEPQNPFGSSELRGLERIMAAVNQAVSDEDIALALEGLGVYATDSGAPVDEDGNETDWVIGPGRVIEKAQNFKRVQGVGSVQPYGDHINRLITFMREASGTPDAAIGKVDVSVAESGVALRMQLAPMLAKADEKDQIILDVHTQMLYDLANAWFPTYEGQSFPGAEVLPVLGDKLPENTAERINQIIQMASTSPPLISAGTARQMIAKVDPFYVFAQDEGALVAQEQAAHTEVTTPGIDPFGSRLTQETTDGTDGSTASGAGDAGTGATDG